MTISSCYKCCGCGELHDMEDDAVDCCKPEIIDGYKCDECGSFYRSHDKGEALKCCATKFLCAKCDAEFYNEDDASKCCGVEYVAPPLTTAELESLGQTRLIP
jgi:hypothetical protein